MRFQAAIAISDLYFLFVFQKLRRLSNLLLPLEDWKQNNLSYERSDEIRNFFLCTPVLEDEGRYT